MLRFFIDRPIFSSVISIIILIAGGASPDDHAGGAVPERGAAGGCG